jgi:hypothetical protein
MTIKWWLTFTVWFEFIRQVVFFFCRISLSKHVFSTLNFFNILNASNFYLRKYNPHFLKKIINENDETSLHVKWVWDDQFINIGVYQLKRSFCLILRLHKWISRLFPNHASFVNFRSNSRFDSPCTNYNLTKSLRQLSFIYYIQTSSSAFNSRHFSITSV